MSIKQHVLKVGLAAAIVLAGTAASFAAAAYATGSVNVRRGPGTEYSVVDQLRRGESVDVRRCTGGWCLVSKPGPDGWVSASYLARDRYDDDFYEDDADFYIRDPRFYRRPFYRERYRDYDNSVCFGGPNAQLCISD